MFAIDLLCCILLISIHVIVSRGSPGVLPKHRCGNRCGIKMRKNSVHKFEFKKLVMFITSPGSILMSTIIPFVSDLSECMKLAMCTPEGLLINF